MPPLRLVPPVYCRKYSHHSPRLLGPLGPTHTPSRLFKNASLLGWQVGLDSVLGACSWFLFPFVTKNDDALFMFRFAVARFDFSWMDASYHQETLNNLRKAAQNVNKLCPVS